MPRISAINKSRVSATKLSRPISRQRSLRASESSKTVRVEQADYILQDRCRLWTRSDGPNHAVNMYFEGLSLERQGLELWRTDLGGEMIFSRFPYPNSGFTCKIDITALSGGAQAPGLGRYLLKRLRESFGTFALVGQLIGHNKTTCLIALREAVQERETGEHDEQFFRRLTEKLMQHNPTLATIPGDFTLEINGFDEDPKDLSLKRELAHIPNIPADRPRPPIKWINLPKLWEKKEFQDWLFNRVGRASADDALFQSGLSADPDRGELWDCTKAQVARDRLEGRSHYRIHTEHDAWWVNKVSGADAPNY